MFYFELANNDFDHTQSIRYYGFALAHLCVFIFMPFTNLLHLATDL